MSYSDSNLSDSFESEAQSQSQARTQIREQLDFLLSLASATARNPNQEPNSTGFTRNTIRSGSSAATLIQGPVEGLDSLPEESGQLPASKDSIESMPRTTVTESGKECAICLEEFLVGGEAREMPCKHGFHSGCVEKWLGIHGSCPVCRFVMPVDEEKRRVTVSLWLPGDQLDLDEERQLDGLSTQDLDLSYHSV